MDVFFRRTCSIITLFLMMGVLAGCGGKRVDMPFSSLDEDSPYRMASTGVFKTEPFSEKLCIVSANDGKLSEDGDDSSFASAVLFNVAEGETVFAEDAFKKLYPASTTKVMTAICAMKYGQKEDEIVCTDSVYITESGAQLFGLDAGDRITLDQAMHALMMYSANDAAVAIAEGISGSVEEFAELMNSEAKKLGCQNTHFVNPHGLHDDDHYTTPYDLYLMFNEAVKYDWFTDIIGTKEYKSLYKAADGSEKSMELGSTNLYLKGDVKPPEGVTVVGGKTGTTMAAGNNLVLYSRDGAGNPYISIVMRARERALLYKWMNALLEKEK